VEERVVSRLQEKGRVEDLPPRREESKVEDALPQEKVKLWTRYHLLGRSSLLAHVVGRSPPDSWG
jgi:hypothetical protein